MKTHQRLGVWNSDIGRGLWWKQWIGTRLGPNDLRRLRSNRKWFVVRPLGRGFENARSWILAGLLCRTKQWTLQLNDHRSQPSRWYCCLQALGHQLHSKWKPTVRYGQRGYHRPEKWPAPSGWSSVSLPFLQWRHFFFQKKATKFLTFEIYATTGWNRFIFIRTDWNSRHVSLAQHVSDGMRQFIAETVFTLKWNSKFNGRVNWR